VQQATPASPQAWAARGLLLASLLFAALALPASHASASSVTFRTYAGSFGPDGAAGTRFGRPQSVAVDKETHDIYIADAESGRVYRFNEHREPVDFTSLGSNYITGVSLFGFFGGQIAVDSSRHILYVTNQVEFFNTSLLAFDSRTGEPVDFSSGPGAGTNEIGGFTVLTGVAVDSAGDIYAADFFSLQVSSGAVLIFEPSGEQINLFEVPQADNVAVDSQGDAYVNSLEGELRKFTPDAFPPTASTIYSLASVVDSNVTTSVAIEPGTGNVYADEGNRIVEYDPAGAMIEAFSNGGNGATSSGNGAVSGSTGVAADLDKVYAATFSTTFGGTSGQVSVYPTITIPDDRPPVISATSSSNVTSSEATLKAQINPSAAPTIYRFEYGLTDLYGQRTPPGGPLAPDEVDHLAAGDISGLTPGTTYHYRVDATNFSGTVYGPDRTFTTQSAPPSIGSASAAVVTGPTRPEGEVLPHRLTCKKGFVKKKGRCVRKRRRDRGHHHRKGAGKHA
jgi:hypothetical protein